MTDVRKSDAQLDAEAAAPEDRDLDAAIRVHRLLYKAETWIPRLHTRGGNVGSTTATWKDSADADPGDRSVVSGSIGWTGMAFNPIFAAFLDEQYGAFPWSKALLHLRWRVCRTMHKQHLDRPEWRGSLCWTLVNLVIRHETSLDYARLQLGLPEEGKTRRTLDSALLVMERRLETLLSEDKAKQSLPARTPQEWMAAAYEHRSLPGLHSEECPQCRRRHVA